MLRWITIVALVLPGYISAGERQYVLDRAGRIIGVVDGEGAVTTYTYDLAGNRLTRATLTGLAPESLWALIPDMTVPGTVFDTTVAGDGLATVTEVAFEQPGLTAELRDEATSNTLPIRITVGPGVPQGSYPFTLSRSAGPDLESGSVVLVVGAPTLGTKPAILLMPDPLILSESLRLNLTLAVPTPAPPGGQAFELATTDPAVATAPTWVNLPAGSASVAVPVDAFTEGEVEITAIRAGFTSGHATVSVQPLPPPEIDSMSRRLAVPDEIVNGFVVRGENLLNTTFTADRAGVVASEVVLDPSGTTGTMRLTFAPNADGTFVVVATNPAGSSPGTPDPAEAPVNTIEVIEAGADDDGDGLNNAEEVAMGSNPFDAASLPLNTFVAAPPSIRVVRPASVQDLGLNMFVAAPPSVRVVRAKSVEQGALSTFVANPPITVLPPEESNAVEALEGDGPLPEPER